MPEPNNNNNNLAGKNIPAGQSFAPKHQQFFNTQLPVNPNELRAVPVSAQAQNPNLPPQNVPVNSNFGLNTKPQPGQFIQNQTNPQASDNNVVSSTNLNKTNPNLSPNNPSVPYQNSSQSQNINTQRPNPATNIPQRNFANVPKAQNNPQGEFINPNNIERVLGKENVIRPPENPNSSNPNRTLSDADIEELQKRARAQKPSKINPGAIPATSNTSTSTELIGLMIYVIPLICIIYAFFKASPNQNIQKHARQSLIAQVIWLGMGIIFRIIDQPVISYGYFSILGFWNLICYGVLVYTGIKAYMKEFFRIPFAYDLASSYIEGD